jgi:hypothetical protein
MIKKIVVNDGVYIGEDFFSQNPDCHDAEEVWIENDFEIDNDAAVGFGCLKSLERFKIINPSSPFFVEDGLLYINIGEETIDRSPAVMPEFISCSMVQGLNRRNSMVWRSTFNPDTVGKVLVAIPPAYPKKDIVIPEGVVGICQSSIMNCCIDCLTLPQSLKEASDLAIVESTIKELRVPNWKSYKPISWVSVDSTIGIIRSNIDNETLDERIIEYWRSCL